MIWFTSDLHLGHANVIRHNSRPFSSVGQMDAALIAAINDRVSMVDTLYVLGDFSMSVTLDQVRAYRSRIVCQDVRLVRGNHDKHFDGDGTSPFSEECDYVELFHGHRRICCMHYPILAWREMERDALMLHGHVHSDASQNRANRAAGILRYDVGVDANDYAPVSIDKVVGFFEGVASSQHRHTDG